MIMVINGCFVPVFTKKRIISELYAYAFFEI